MENIIGWLIPTKLGEDYEGTTSSTVILYGYMLKRYTDCKKQGTIYSETQLSLAENSMLSLSALKVSISFLEKHNLLVTTKKKELNYSKNCYELIDVYNLYSYSKPIVQEVSGVPSWHEHNQKRIQTLLAAIEEVINKNSLSCVEYVHELRELTKC